jgi:ATP-dependent helicase/nuclease subunit B
MGKARCAPTKEMKHLYCGNFRELQARFIAEVSRQRKPDPLAPLNVIVNGQLMRMSLKRELARAGCSHANVHFRTLHELAEYETETARQRQGLRPLPDMMREPLMLRAIETASPLSYFGELAAREGFRAALWRTLDDLRKAGIHGDLLGHVCEKKSARTSTLGRKLRDLAALLLALEKLLRDQKYADAVRTLELACEEKSDNEIPLILYGADELSALELRFFLKQLGRSDVAVYLPYRDGDTHQWVRPLFSALCGMGFIPDFLPESASQMEITLVSAPTRDREIEEIASELLQESHDDERIGVLVRDGESYVPLLRETLTQAGLNGYFHQCHTLGETNAGRAFRLLSALLDLKFTRGDVTEFLLSSPVIWPEALTSTQSAPPPAALWNQITLLAGITSGEDSWHDGLRRLRNRLEREQQTEIEEDDGRALPAGYRDAAESLQHYTEYLFRRLREIRRLRSWTETAAGLGALFSELVEHGEESASVRQEWERMTELDALGIAPTVDNIRMQINAVLKKPAEREGHFQTHEPTVATFGETQGVLFDAVFIPGVVERELPRPVSQDPLLLDDERKQLAQWINPHQSSIPLRSERRHRERFTFETALVSARRIMLLYPRRENGGRERLPSSYLLDVLETLTGQPADYNTLQRYFASQPNARRIPAGRLRSGRGFPPTAFARDLSRYGLALQQKSFAPIADAYADHLFLKNSAIAEEARFRQRDFSRYDGLIENENLQTQLASRLARRAFAPTRMETYAVCPFRFFALHVLNLNPVEEPDELLLITALQRGLLIHRILERFYREEQAAGHIPLQRGAEDRLMSEARRTFAAYEHDIVTGPPLLWRIEQKRMLDALRRFIEREFADNSGFIPHLFEQEFSFDFTDGVTLTFRGKMDRVDVNPTDGCARVVDYKSGKSRAGMKDGGLLGGQALQLPVYRLAVERALNYEGAAAVYYYLAEESDKPSIEYTRAHWEAGHDTFVQIVSTIFTGISGGRFYPNPERANCERCPVRTACGTGRMTFKWRRPSPDTQAYRDMREANA